MNVVIVLCNNLDNSIIEKSFIGIIVIVTVFVIEIIVYYRKPMYSNKVVINIIMISCNSF